MALFRRKTASAGLTEARMESMAAPALEAFKARLRPVEVMADEFVCGPGENLAPEIHAKCD